MEMSRSNVYQEIKRRCNLVLTARSNDYEHRTEYWKHGRIQYTVLLKVTPRQDRVLRICGCVLN